MPAKTRSRSTTPTSEISVDGKAATNDGARDRTIADLQNSPQDVQGPITEAYGMDPKQVVQRLNEMRSTEIVAYLQYKQHAYMSISLIGPAVKAEFLEHANQELEHADKLAERIQQLGGTPLYDLSELGSIAQGMQIRAQQGCTLEEMAMEDLELERKQVKEYTEYIREVGDRDPVTRRVLEDILIDTEHHASELRDMLQHRTE